MIKFYLGEQPILNNVQTFRCSHKTELKYIIENIDKLVVKEVHERVWNANRPILFKKRN